MTRPPKKSEWLEVRLAHEAKRAFMARCQAEGRSASEVVRSLIDGYAGAARTRPRRLHLALAAVALLAVGAAAAPSLARPSLRSEFTRLDADHDGKLSRAEFEHAAEVSAVVRVAGVKVEQPVTETGRIAMADTAFARLDADHDGVISYAEFRKAYGR